MKHYILFLYNSFPLTCLLLNTLNDDLAFYLREFLFFYEAMIDAQKYFKILQCNEVHQDKVKHNIIQREIFAVILVIKAI